MLALLAATAESSNQMWHEREAAGQVPNVSTVKSAEGRRLSSTGGLQGLVLWLDASDASTITQTTGLTSWADKSGLSPALFAKPTRSTLPSVECCSPSGLQIVHLQQAPLQIQNSVGVSTTRSLPETTIFMVLDPDSSYSWYWCFYRPGFYGTHTGLGSLQNNLCRIKKYVGLTSQAFYDGLDQWDTDNPAGCGWNVLAWTVGPSTNKLFVNGVLHKDDIVRGTLGEESSSSSRYSWMLGARHDDREVFGSLKIAEMQVFNQETTDDQYIIDQSNRLLAKWITGAAPPPSSPVASQGDPHLTLAHGARADFRGRHGVIYNFMSTPSLSVNVQISNASFYLRPPPNYANITVHGTMITAAYIVARTSGGEWLNVTYSADMVKDNHARRDVVTASCSVWGNKYGPQPMTVQPGNVAPCGGHLLYQSFSTLDFPHYHDGDSWDLKIRSLPVYDRIDGAHHRLDLVFDLKTPEAALTSLPHGIIGQSFDGDGRAKNGALDEYPHTEGAVFTTYAMAEGAIEGGPSDYEMSSPYDVKFKYSRFGKKRVGNRNQPKLTTGPVPVEANSYASAGAAGDRFPRRHVEL